MLIIDFHLTFLILIMCDILFCHSIQYANVALLFGWWLVRKFLENYYDFPDLPILVKYNY